MDDCVVVFLEEKKLVSVKTRLERSFWWPWLATTVQPRQSTFAWIDVLAKNVEQFLFLQEKSIKFCLCLISMDSKFNALVRKVIGASFFSRIHSGKSRKRSPAATLKIFTRKLPQTLLQPAGLMGRVRIVLGLLITTVATM